MDMNEIVLCKTCLKPEFYGEMRWLNGHCTCRNCYKTHYEKEYNKKYTSNDLEGVRPTLEDYYKQEIIKEEENI